MHRRFWSLATRKAKAAATGLDRPLQFTEPHQEIGKQMSRKEILEMVVKDLAIFPTWKMKCTPLSPSLPPIYLYLCIVASKECNPRMKMLSGG
jgi:hypothetical protein